MYYWNNICSLLYDQQPIMKPAKLLLLLFCASAIWLMSCSKSDKPDPVDSFAWIDNYSGSYNAEVHYHTSAYSQSWDTTYKTIAYIKNLRYNDSVYYYGPAQPKELLPVIQYSVQESSGFGLTTILGIKRTNDTMASASIPWTSCKFKNDSLIINCRPPYSVHGAYYYTIKGIKIK